MQSFVMTIMIWDYNGKIEMANKHNEKQKQNNIMKYLDNKIVQLVLIYLAWIVAHYVAAHLYVCVCVFQQPSGDL